MYQTVPGDFETLVTMLKARGLGGSGGGTPAPGDIIFENDTSVECIDLGDGNERIEVKVNGVLVMTITDTSLTFKIGDPANEICDAGTVPTNKNLALPTIAYLAALIADCGAGTGEVTFSNVASEPAAPASGGILYCFNGALKWIGQAGTRTTLANA